MYKQSFHSQHMKNVVAFLFANIKKKLKAFFYFCTFLSQEIIHEDPNKNFSCFLDKHIKNIIHRIQNTAWEINRLHWYAFGQLPTCSPLYFIMVILRETSIASQTNI